MKNLPSRIVKTAMIFAAVLLMLHKARSESYMFCEHGRLASGIVYLYKGDFSRFTLIRLW